MSNGSHRKARLGFIGAGWWATTNHMPVLAARNDVDMVSVCRLGDDELQLVKNTFGFEHATQDFQEVVERDDLDGIVVSSPHTLHFQHAMAALESGKHVMCEKPLTTNADHARRLVDEAERRGLEIVIPHGWHYKPFVQQAKSLMDSGCVGKIEFVMCHMASPVRTLLEGKRFLSDGGAAGDVMFEPAADTWADPDVAGGGYALAQMSHSAGMLFWLTNLKTNRVSAMTSAPTSKVEMYDTFNAEFQGGAIGSFSGAGSLPDDQNFQLDIRVFGSEGVMVLDIDRARLEVQRYDKKHINVDVTSNAGEYYGGGPPENFVDLILGKDDTNYAPGWAGMRAIELIDAAYRSAKSGTIEAV